MMWVTNVLHVFLSRLSLVQVHCVQILHVLAHVILDLVDWTGHVSAKMDTLGITVKNVSPLLWSVFWFIF